MFLSVLPNGILSVRSLSSCYYDHEIIVSDLQIRVPSPSRFSYFLVRIHRVVHAFHWSVGFSRAMLPSALLLPHVPLRHPATVTCLRLFLSLSSTWVGAISHTPTEELCGAISV